MRTGHFLCPQVPLDTSDDLPGSGVKLLKLRQSLAGGTALATAFLLTACGGSKPPVVALPPAPPPMVIPPQPAPPRGASPNFQPPRVDGFGVRQTINTAISPAQTTWNLRSAYNVAALNCLDAKHGQIVVNYRAFLKTHARKLTAVNKAVDNEFKAKYGSRFIAPREAYMTQVYNFYALPPVLATFCDASLQMSTEIAALPQDQLDAYAARELPAINAVFEAFFRSYDQYKVDLASWQSRYAGPQQVTPISGPAIALPAVAASTMTQPGATAAR